MTDRLIHFALFLAGTLGGVGLAVIVVAGAITLSRERS